MSLGRPKGQVTDTEPLEQWEYYLLLSHLAEHWRLACEVLWETGIRIGECLALQTRRDLDGTGIWVTREKRKDHPREHINLSPRLLARARLFGLSHKDVRVFPFTSSAAWVAIKKASAAASVRKTMHPHLFRHGMGHRANRAGYTDAMVQQLLGHKDIRSVQHYTRPTKLEVNDARDKLNRTP